MCKTTLAAPLCSLLLLFGQQAHLAGQEVEPRPADPRLGTRSVHAYGAVGDGQQDDSAAIQKAVDAGGLVHFPRGVFRLTRTIRIDLDRTGYVSLAGDGVARIVMAGAGPAFEFPGTQEKSADPGGFAAAVWDRQRMPLVDGIALQGAHPEAEGIAAAGTMQLTITRVHARHLLHAIRLSGNNRNVLIADSHFYENRGCGVLYDQVNLHQSNITGCHISYNAGGGIVSRGGNVRNLHVTGCDIESNMAPDAPATANVLIDCTGSQYGTGEVAITGCTIQHNNPSPDSANIRILGRTQPTATQPLVREGNVTITGNVLSDVQVNLHLRDCRGVTITGNTFWQGYRHNLLVEDSTAVVVGANNFDRNPRYDYGNTRDANNSLVFRGCTDCILTGLLVTNVWRNPAAVTVENCRRCTISQCSIFDSDRVGLWLKNCTDCRVSDCVIRDDRPHARPEDRMQAVVVEGGSGNWLTDNLWTSPLRGQESAAQAVDNHVVEPRVAER